MKQGDTNAIRDKIYVIRGVKVMLDKDLAELYGVETRTLNQSVKRNMERFPGDFIFQLNDEEFNSLISHFVISKRGGTRKRPYAFAQNGIAMLSSVLSSKEAIEVNVRIMRIFTHTEELHRNQTHIYNKIHKIEKQGLKNTEEIQLIFNTIKETGNLGDEKPKKRIGFD